MQDGECGDLETGEASVRGPPFEHGETVKNEDVLIETCEAELDDDGAAMYDDDATATCDVLMCALCDSQWNIICRQKKSTPSWARTNCKYWVSSPRETRPNPGVCRTHRERERRKCLLCFESTGGTLAVLSETRVLGRSATTADDDREVDAGVNGAYQRSPLFKLMHASEIMQTAFVHGLQLALRFPRV